MMYCTRHHVPTPINILALAKEMILDIANKSTYPKSRRQRKQSSCGKQWKVESIRTTYWDTAVYGGHMMIGKSSVRFGQGVIQGFLLQSCLVGSTKGRVSNND